LKAPGAVFLLDHTGPVNFTIGFGLAPPARGSDQSGTALVAAALANSGRARRSTHIAYRTGSTSDRLYGDCAPIDGWMVAVVVRDNAAWEAFAPPRPFTSGQSTPGGCYCEYCGQGFGTFEAPRCDKCGQPRCPDGHCGCTATRERLCAGCFLTKHVTQFDSASSVCRDCSE
jgi:hypothetical protein